MREKRGDSSDPRGQGGGWAGLSEEAASELGREGGRTARVEAPTGVAEWLSPTGSTGAWDFEGKPSSERKGACRGLSARKL